MDFKCEKCNISVIKQTTKLCRKCYHKEWYKEYSQRPEVKKRKSEYYKKWKKNNLERVKFLKKKWNKENPEKVSLMNKKQREKGGEELLQKKKEYSSRPEVKARRRDNYDGSYYKEKSKDIGWKLSKNLSRAIWGSLKGKKEGIKWEKLVGYTTEDLKKHLEFQFKDSMTWKNYGTFWEIDHKIPLSAFRITSLKDSQFKACWNLGNLRPLEVSKNRSKGNRYIEIGQSYLKS